MEIFDSHAHYYDDRFAREAEGGADAILRAVMPDPVRRIVNVGTNCETSRKAIAQAKKYEGMYAAVGIHPEDCHYLADFDAAMQELADILGDAEKRKADKIVAIGEIGLDYHWEQYGEIPMSREREVRYFDAQMSLAETTGLPVIIHDREAHGDCFDTVLRHPDVRGVFHSYSGSPELAAELVRRGWYLSFSGTLTFTNARKVREVAATVPRDRVLVETDCPYLAPHPKRGSLNHSGLLPYTLSALAQIWGVSPDEAAAQTFQNAEKLFLC